MRIKFRRKNRMIVIAECVWHPIGSYLPHYYFTITPTLTFCYLSNGCWTVDIIWLRLYITFGIVPIHNKYAKI